MIKLGILLGAAAFLALSGQTAEAKSFPSDVFTASGGELKITFIGHGTLMMEYQGKVIQIDPWTKLADYSNLPKADLVLVTHEHRDHLDPKALEQTMTPKTELVMSASCADKAKGKVMANGDKIEIMGLTIEAVPAYNLVHKRDNGQPFHPQGRGNGYVVTFGDKRVYIAGDTENIPDMKNLKDIDIAFLPMNLPYTMTPAMTADAAKMFGPKVLYPYHYGQTDPQELVGLLKNNPEIEVRIRPLQ